MKNYIILLLTLTFSTALAQPNPQWFHMYDNQEVENIIDVYALADGDYAACGLSSLRGYWDLNSPMDVWVLRLDDEGEIVWANTYGDADFREGSCSLIETDDVSIFVDINLST